MVYTHVSIIESKNIFALIGRASRTEKYLGACAAGKWVLHKSFLEESRACGAFVKEESHEWGVAKAGGTIQPLEAAPKTWRLALAEKQRQVGNLGMHVYRI